MPVFDRNFTEMFSAQIMTLIGGLIAGTILAVYTDKLILLPGFLILLPGFLAMRGDISGTLAARLSSGLFLGFVNPSKYNSKIVRGNIIGSFMLVLITTLALGFIAFIFNWIIFDSYTPVIILVALGAGILANIIEIPLTLFFTFYFFKKGHDPDNIMGPFITTIGDITSMASLLIIISII